MRNMLVLSRPTIARIHKGKALVRPGKGFSRAEVRQAGISIAQAKKLQVRFDLRRKTVYQSNVDLLMTTAGELREASSESKRETE